MPTPEQWKQFAEMQNKYRYGQPTPEPRMLVNRPVEPVVSAVVPTPRITSDFRPETQNSRGPLLFMGPQNIVPRSMSEEQQNAIVTSAKNNLPAPLAVTKDRTIYPFTPGQERGPNLSDYAAEERVKKSAMELLKGNTPTTPAAPQVPPTPQTPVERLAAQAQALKDQNAVTSVPVGVEATPGTTAYYTGRLGSQGPTTTATVPGKGTTTFQPDTGINDAAVMPGTRSGQIFSGASTDAEAVRNLQARTEQNQAAQFNINNMNRGAEAERDLRAARLGVSRGVLDRMEGRNDTEAAVAAAAAQSATSNQFNPLSMPGDNFYDTRARQATYDSAVKQALAGNKREQQGAAAALTALNDLREKNLAAQVAQSKGQTGVDPVDMGKFLLDQEKFKQTQDADANKFLLDKERFNYQQGLDKERLAVDRNEAEGKQAERQLARQKYMDESRKAFVNEFTFSDPKAPREQIAGAVFDISQATGVPLNVVSQFYEQTVKDLKKDGKLDYAKGGPKDPMALNKLVAARITQAYQGQ